VSPGAGGFWDGRDSLRARSHAGKPPGVTVRITSWTAPWATASGWMSRGRPVPPSRDSRDVILLYGRSSRAPAVSGHCRPPWAASCPDGSTSAPAAACPTAARLGSIKGGRSPDDVRGWRSTAQRPAGLARGYGVHGQPPVVSVSETEARCWGRRHLREQRLGSGPGRRIHARFPDSLAGGPVVDLLTGVISPTGRPPDAPPDPGRSNRLEIHCR